MKSLETAMSQTRSHDRTFCLLKLEERGIDDLLEISKLQNDGHTFDALTKCNKYPIGWWERIHDLKGARHFKMTF